MSCILSFDVGIKNLAFCLFDVRDTEIKKWGLLTLHGDVNRAAVNLADIFRGMHDVVKDADVVLVEKQPGRNKTMVRIEAYIHMYFVAMGKKVVLYSARNKLARTECSFRGKGKDNYSLRKKASISLTKEFITSEHTKQHQDMIDLFNKSKKKDDLADALLQALSYSKWDPPASSVPQEACSDANSITPVTPEAVMTMVKARAPTTKQIKSGKFSISNLKHYTNKSDIAALCATQRGLEASILKYFASVEDCINTLKIT